RHASWSAPDSGPYAPVGSRSEKYFPASSSALRKGVPPLAPARKRRLNHFCLLLSAPSAPLGLSNRPWLLFTGIGLAWVGLLTPEPPLRPWIVRKPTRTWESSSLNAMLAPAFAAFVLVR